MLALVARGSRPSSPPLDKDLLRHQLKCRIENIQDEVAQKWAARNSGRNSLNVPTNNNSLNVYHAQLGRKKSRSVGDIVAHANVDGSGQPLQRMPSKRGSLDSRPQLQKAIEKLQNQHAAKKYTTSMEDMMKNCNITGR